MVAARFSLLDDELEQRVDDLPDAFLAGQVFIGADVNSLAGGHGTPPDMGSHQELLKQKRRLSFGGLIPRIERVASRGTAAVSWPVASPFTWAFLMLH